MMRASKPSDTAGRLEVTDKIGLPLSYANSIYQRAELGADLVTCLAEVGLNWALSQLSTDCRAWGTYGLAQYVT